ncbi:DUF1799 domain-containing protein [Pseudomonas sp. DTU_2021_1001937_2_SI_NGA_ILE_001]|uniref:DUF1799 domain-containing protein n=1 Tax=Pseudomonas sp. DTU_2021_1001937_2_SI_NGA_ILE_001 TaxID=3077589 RepID=UPI0028FC2E3C|nr:DUF1799 domain-containing protein [Pseudomonas sp. DTU_2021_1001937_2_SI_NGA_ILE_001]WNW10131.1 DUF1799 domain-containing protein [Pseudomonas sp. DTU_2021_1001937_2_SI_NGA_ILE_001]
MFGLSPEDAEETVEVWECNRQALVLFDAMGTQWRSGMNGATGLEYQALPVTMDLLGMDVGDRQALFRDIRVMERAALDAMAEARDE